jgi:hypothetical protein
MLPFVRDNILSSSRATLSYLFILWKDSNCETKTQVLVYSMSLTVQDWHMNRKWTDQWNSYAERYTLLRCKRRVANDNNRNTEKSSPMPRSGWQKAIRSRFFLSSSLGLTIASAISFMSFENPSKKALRNQRRAMALEEANHSFQLRAPVSHPSSSSTVSALV